MGSNCFPVDIALYSEAWSKQWKSHRPTVYFQVVDLRLFELTHFKIVPHFLK
jgi:hypothetical protein